ncbi:MAG: ComEC/Rec2 family competence protein [Clostridia bacterium]|nr:ComEC/Rec2 family competence protein [Clostridia bacterium]
MKSKFKLFNFRFFAILLAFCYVGGWIGIEIYDKFDIFYYLLGAGFACALVLFIVLKRRSVLYLVIIAVFLLTVLSSASVVLDAVTYTPNLSGDLVLTRVEYVSVDNSVVYVSVIGGLEKPPKGEGKLTLTDGYETDFIKEGGILTLSGVNITPHYVLEKDEESGEEIFHYENLSKRVKFSISANQVENYSYSPSLAQIMRNSLSSVVDENLPDEVKGVTYALFTGDKYGIEENLYGNYRVSGVAHVLAVSGLHVTFLVSFLNAILNKIRMKRSKRLIIILPILLLFNLLCGFTPSVVRASVMSAVFTAAPVISRKRYDTLSAMSLSGVILILVNPLNVLSYGYILSFVCVFGVVALTQKFTKLLSFLPKSLSSVCAMSISASLAVFPLTVSFFGYFSVLGLVANVLVVPVLSAFYGILFLVAVVCAILPFLGFLLYAVSVVIYYINGVVSFIAGLSFASINIKIPLWFTISYYTLGLCLTDYIFLGKGVKRAVALLFGATCFTCILLSSYGVGI